MRILVSGSSGFIGSSLVPFLTAVGHRVTRLMRTQPPSRADAVWWDPLSGTLDGQALEGADAVVHLSGERISGRWTPERKARLRNSRVRSTQLLAQTLAKLQHPPAVWLSTSGIGYYGNCGAEVVDEHSAGGAGFLASLCQEWEAATVPASERGIRVVYMRIGMVLSPQGGALGMMLPPFRFGLGGRLGNGRQYISWITLEDLLGAMQHVLMTPALQGPVNMVSPTPVTNAEFTRLLGRVLARPTLFPTPALMLRAVFGEFADEALLTSTRAMPGALLATGYRFLAPELEEALRGLLQRPAPH